MRKLLPVLLALLGTGAGVGAGLVLSGGDAPAAETADADGCVPCETALAETLPPVADAPAVGREYVKMNNQFVVPVITEDRVTALVVASLSLEMTAGQTTTVYDYEPKLRDVFLQVLLDHASIGGFEGQFTTGPRMDRLRQALLEAAKPVLGSKVHAVLITEIARQDA